MHQFDADARGEAALCGTEVSVLNLTTAQDFLERRGNDSRFRRSTAAARHRQAIPFAKMRLSALLAEGLTDEAEIYRWVADTLSRETEP